jgi:hypothetical protein
MPLTRRHEIIIDYIALDYSKWLETQEKQKKSREGAKEADKKATQQLQEQGELAKVPKPDVGDAVSPLYESLQSQPASSVPVTPPRTEVSSDEEEAQDDVREIDADIVEELTERFHGGKDPESMPPGAAEYLRQLVSQYSEQISALKEERDKLARENAEAVRKQAEKAELETFVRGVTSELAAEDTAMIEEREQLIRERDEANEKYEREHTRRKESEARLKRLGDLVRKHLNGGLTSEERREAGEMLQTEIEDINTRIQTLEEELESRNIRIAQLEQEIEEQASLLNENPSTDVPGLFDASVNDEEEDGEEDESGSEDEGEFSASEGEGGFDTEDESVEDAFGAEDDTDMEGESDEDLDLPMPTQAPYPTARNEVIQQVGITDVPPLPATDDPQSPPPQEPPPPPPPPQEPAPPPQEPPSVAASSVPIQAVDDPRAQREYEVREREFLTAYRAYKEEVRKEKNSDLYNMLFRVSESNFNTFSTKANREARVNACLQDAKAAYTALQETIRSQNPRISPLSLERLGEYQAELDRNDVDITIRDFMGPNVSETTMEALYKASHNLESRRRSLENLRELAQNAADQGKYEEADGLMMQFQSTLGNLRYNGRVLEEIFQGTNADDRNLHPDVRDFIFNLRDSLQQIDKVAYDADSFHTDIQAAAQTEVLARQVAAVERLKEYEQEVAYEHLGKMGMLPALYAEMADAQGRIAIEGAKLRQQLEAGEIPEYAYYGRMTELHARPREIVQESYKEALADIHRQSSAHHKEHRGRFQTWAWSHMNRATDDPVATNSRPTGVR